MVPFGMFLFNLGKIMNSPHSDNPVAFLEKIKKQAKKILKLSKNNGLKIEIKSLSEAQNLLAEINGYPDWHALISNFNNLVNKSEIQKYVSEDIIANNKDKLFLQDSNGIYTLHENNEITSFFELTTFPLDSYYAAREWMLNFKHDIALKWNMQFHRVNVLFNFCQNENGQSEQHTFFKWSSILGINKEQFDDLFSLELTPQSTEFGLQVICSISTLEGMFDEHLSFCKEFSNDFINKKYIYKEQYDCLLNSFNQKPIYFNESETVNKLRNLISLNPENNSERENLNWFYGLQFLYQKKTPIKLVAQISNINQSLFVIPNTELPNNYIMFLKGLWASLNQKIYGEFKIEEPINLLPINEPVSGQSNSGIPFINKTDGNIIHIDPNNPNQYHQTNFIYAKPGSGKSILINSINIDTVLSKSTNGELPYLGIIDIGPSSKGMIDFLQNTLENQYKKQVVYYKLTNDDVINPFDTELGCRYPCSEQQNFLSNFISLILSNDNSLKLDILPSYINHLITSMYKQLSDEGTPFKYDRGVNKKIDKIIQEINYPITVNTTWWNIVDLLFQHHYIKEAKIAQRHANPMLAYIFNINSTDITNDIYGRVIVSTGESLSKYVGRVISEALNQFPNFSKLTSLDLGEAKIISLDLDNLCKSGGLSSQHSSAINYALASFALIKHSKWYLKSMEVENDIIPQHYKEYYQNEIKKVQSNLASISFDEYHRVSTFDAINKIVMQYFKNSRKYYFSFTIASQSLEDYINFCEVCNNNFIYATDLHPSNKITKTINDNIRDKQVLAHLKNHSRLKHMDILFSSNTKNGIFEKIVSLKLNPFILWTINTLYENVYIREYLTKEIGYINAIKLLVEKYPYGIKKAVEIILENNINLSREDAIEQLIKQVSK